MRITARTDALLAVWFAFNLGIGLAVLAQKLAA